LVLAAQYCQRDPDHPGCQDDCRRSGRAVSFDAKTAVAEVEKSGAAQCKKKDIGDEEQPEFEPSTPPAARRHVATPTVTGVGESKPKPALTLISPLTLFRQLHWETRRRSRRHTSPGKSVTARTSMKTIMKPGKPFFPSCIMDLGALASPKCAACRDTPAEAPYTLTLTSCVRGSSPPCRLLRLGSLTTA
jgi:hypothetical protein